MNKQTLNINNLTKSYDGKTLANNQIHLRVEPGKITALLGHNGAGKSTLLNQMIGFIKPDQGDIYYGELSLIKHRKQARSLISYMSQQYAPLEKLSVEQNLTILGKIRGLSSSTLKDRVTQLLKDLDILEYRHRLGKDLSGGLKRLTSFAMALIGAPAIILLDEPTNDVDPIRREKQWQLLQELAQKGHSILIVTHNLLEVEKYADHFALFHHGKLLKTGTVQQINHKPHYEISFQFSSPHVLRAFNDYKLINVKICQIELSEIDFIEMLPRLHLLLKKKEIFAITIKEQQLSISDLYRKEFSQSHEIIV